MEDSCILDTDNDICSVCKQFSFQKYSLILILFVQTEHNMTPHQVWVQGLNNLAQENPNHLFIEGISNNEVHISIQLHTVTGLCFTNDCFMPNFNFH